MEFNERKIKGVFEISLDPYSDDRGFFMRTYDAEIFKKSGINYDWVQENHSRSEKKYTIRGLHFQFPPFTETKLVRCTRGAVMDVFIDLREGSKTFGEWDNIELSESNKKIILIPRGFAHGFCTLTDISEVIYKVDNFYSKEKEAGILWSDPDLKIDWPTRNPIISEKDKQNMTLRKFIEKYQAIC